MMVLAQSKEHNREGFIIFLVPNGGSSVRILNTAVSLMHQNMDNIQPNVQFMHQNLSKPIEKLKMQLLISLLTYLLTDLLTYLIRILFLEKQTGSQLVKKFPEFYGTQRFSTSFTSALHLTLSRGISPRSMLITLTSRRFFLILSSHLRLGLTRGSHPQVSPPKFCIYLSSPHTCYVTHASHFSRFDYANNIWLEVQIINLLAPELFF